MGGFAGGSGEKNLFFVSLLPSSVKIDQPLKLNGRRSFIVVHFLFCLMLVFFCSRLVVMQRFSPVDCVA